MVAVATASRPYPCLHPKCKKSFTKGSDLKRHEKLHLPKEELDAVKFRCKFPGCNNTSLQLSNLKTHMNKMHYNVKNKKCSECGFKTADSSELTRHRSCAHKYTPKKRLSRQKNIGDDGTIGEDYCDEGGDGDEDKREDIDMALPESPPTPQSMTSSSGTSLGMELYTPPHDNHRVNVNIDIDMAVIPVPPPSPAFTGSRHSMCYTPPPAATSPPAPLYVASPPRNTDSDMMPLHSSAPSSHHGSMSYAPPPSKTRPTDRAYLPSPPRSPSPRTSTTSLLGLPAELFITGPRDCQLPRIMSYAD
ncbi:hypothetical protein ARMGADRAFT_1029373 [Armillaria gallica]|uniref:C2H2-type domain-containing protein n=1 Tax=Armillaria gallica TaxID=47427 RepID=A0A2H3DTT2_ARMGA|nr:hypothetical protein ARMGADRAFT_1029373 [Armillaria gallica]